MKILRSKGTSFTRVEVGDSKPTRGLLLRSGMTSSEPVGRSDSIKRSPDLPDFLEQDAGLLLRQYIQWLDKALLKPRSLKDLDVASYVARTHLAEALWPLFCGHLQQVRSDDIDAVETSSLRSRWEARVHPYARAEVSWQAPESDENAKRIADFEAQKAPDRGNRPFSQGRWTETFGVPLDGGIASAFHKAAEAIVSHMHRQEVTIAGKPRRDSGGASGYGLIQKRGQSIADNGIDPRTRANRQERREWSPETETLYFSRGDVAREIALSLEAAPRAGNPKKRFGEALHRHFGLLEGTTGPGTTERKQLWNFHNHVRLYYRRLGESNRFREAISLDEKRKMQQLLPRDRFELIARVNGKRRTGEISELIRLGKLVAHAIDLCGDADSGNDLDQMIRAGMAYFVTSVGQGDIKRNEAFVRVARSSVAYSHRTMTMWLKPGLAAARKVATENRFDTKLEYNADITTNEIGAWAVSQTPVDHIRRHAGLVFGLRKYPFGEDGARTSRTDLLFDGTESDREMLWALLQLASQVRNRAYHFNTKKRLLAATSRGLLSPMKRKSLNPLVNPDGKVGRNGRLVDKEVLGRLEKLVDYDLQLDRQVLADDLNRLRFASHVPISRRQEALAIFGRTPRTDDWVTPKFMAMLSKAAGLLKGGGDAVSELIKPFASLSLTALSKDIGSINSDRIGLLRLLYNRAFPSWLEQYEADASLTRRLLDDILKHKRERRHAYDQQTRRVLAEDERLADTFLDQVTTLTELQARFLANAMEGSSDEPDDLQPASEQLRDPYLPDRTQQSSASGAVEELRRELYLHLFGQFLSDEKLNWIWDMPEPDAAVKAAPVLPEELASETFELPTWQRQLYAWLYLVPVDQVALLQHQFRKTKILEEKSYRERRLLLGNAPDTVDGAVWSGVIARADTMSRTPAELRQLDMLMGLYTRVQAAGFSGEEHQNSIASGALFYEDRALYDQIFSDASEENKISLAGTRTGLRQLSRLGTLSVLRGIFAKHQVTRLEVDALLRVYRSGDATLFEHREAARKALEAEWQKPSPDRSEATLRRLAQDYKGFAAQARAYDFRISAARLADFANLHHMLLDILSRLADFTAMWERDRVFLLLGLLHEAVPAARFDLNDKKVIALRSDDGWSADIHGDREGFEALREPPGLVELVDPATREQLRRFFGMFAKEGPPATENPRDAAARQKLNARAALNNKPVVNAGDHWKSGKSRIRNDLAHFNVLDQARSAGGSGKDRDRINLTYIVNAVRSMFGYDRKLKNAVPAAVSHIVNSYGLSIDWILVGDRLRDAQLSPLLIRHLGFLHIKDATDLSFQLPAASPREVSMAKAMFDFGNSGYLPNDEGRSERLLRYPAHFLDAESSRRVPEEVLAELKLGSEPRK